MTVTVVPIVTDFNADNTTPTEGDTVTFTDTSTGNPTQWSWTLTGATPSTSTAQNPAVVYNTAGTYTVALTASKTGSTDTETKTNYITVALPAAPVTINTFALENLGFGGTQTGNAIETFRLGTLGYIK